MSPRRPPPARLAALVLALWAVLGILSPPPAAASPPTLQETQGIAWRPWGPEVFVQARAQGRPVLLYLEAVWCHWCHVMDQETYADPQVVAAVTGGFIPVRVDQDAHPDLAERYREYGWPATILFGPDGIQRAARRGFLAADELLALLDEVRAGRAPDPPAAAARALGAPGGTLGEDLRAELVARHRARYDERLGGLDLRQKFLDADAVELALALGADDDAEEAARARQTLLAATALIDPVWGGIYQYSTHGDWAHPHFEKIMAFQAGALRVYTEGWQRLGDAALRDAAAAVASYLRTTLQAPEGGFYTSQDADLRPGEHSAGYFALGDAERRALGVPRIDAHVYARENGWAIAALAAWAQATGDRGALADALRAGERILATQAERDADGRLTGILWHGEPPAGGPYLGDTVAFGRAALALHQATADPAWLDVARACADALGARFRAPDGVGFVGADPRTAVLPPQPSVDENVAVARFAALLHAHTGRDADRALGAAALSWLAAPQVALGRITEPGILLAARELGSAPVHVAVVGAPDDDRTVALLDAARALPGGYRRVDLLIPGSPQAREAGYPSADHPQAFLCTATSCSRPLLRPEDVVAAAARR